MSGNVDEEGFMFERRRRLLLLLRFGVVGEACELPYRELERRIGAIS